MVACVVNHKRGLPGSRGKGYNCHSYGQQNHGRPTLCAEGASQEKYAEHCGGENLDTLVSITFKLACVDQ